MPEIPRKKYCVHATLIWSYHLKTEALQYWHLVANFHIKTPIDALCCNLVFNSKMQTIIVKLNTAHLMTWLRFPSTEGPLEW